MRPFTRGAVSVSPPAPNASPLPPPPKLLLLPRDDAEAKLPPAVDYKQYCMEDPCERKMALIDEFFERHNIHTRVDYNEIMNEMEFLLLMHDRVNAAKWALDHLAYKEGVKKAPPLMEEVVPPKTKMPADIIVIKDPTFQKQSGGAKRRTSKPGRTQRLASGARRSLLKVRPGGKE